jgi:glycosyltransferase involved in cell wall biosynthesis
MTRVMFLGDMAGTGFGTVTMDMGRELLALGLDVRFISQNEDGELPPPPFADRTFLVNDPDGTLRLAQDGGIPSVMSGAIWSDGWVPEAAIMLGDFAAARMIVLRDEETVAAFSRIPVLHYVPIEGVDLPPAWAALWQVVRPVAMTNFGAGEIARVTGTTPPVVYHGVHTTDFWPVSPDHPLWFKGEDKDKALRSKEDCKGFFGARKDSTWILRTDRHMPRKRYNSWLRSIVPVLMRNPNTYAVIHCRSFDQGGNLGDALSKYPDAARKRIIVTPFHDQWGGAPRDILSALYNAADIYASNSAEGFGLTIAEALACGTPAVGVGYSAVPEVIGPAGIVVPEGGLIDNEYDHFWWAADERAFGQAVESLVRDPVLRRRLGREGPVHVARSFTWEAAARGFADLIAGAIAERTAA